MQYRMVPYCTTSVHCHVFYVTCSFVQVNSGEWEQGRVGWGVTNRA